MIKFIKVSICIFISLGLFTLGSILFFDDTIHYKDYIDKNKKEVKILYDSQRESKDGICVRLRVINYSKFKFLLTDAKLGFPSYSNKGDLDTLLELNLYNSYEEENEHVMIDGVEQYGEGYVTFLIPKGITLDDRYFDLDSIYIECEGIFKKKLPLLENEYISVARYSGKNLVSSNQESIDMN